MNIHDCHMNDKINNIDDNVQKLMSAIIGDELGNQGIAPRLRTAELEIYRIKKLKWQITGILAVASLIFSALFTFLITLIS